MLEPDEGKLSRPVLRAGGESNLASLTRRYGLRQCVWQHHPTRKRADFPAVSRHENHRGIGTEGVAHVGGLVPLVLPSPITQRTRKLSMEVSMKLRWESTSVSYRAASRFYDC